MGEKNVHALLRANISHINIKLPRILVLRHFVSFLSSTGNEGTHIFARMSRYMKRLLLSNGNRIMKQIKSFVIKRANLALIQIT